MVKRHLGDTVASDAINTLIVDGMASILTKLEHPMVRFPKFEIQDYQPGKNLIATAVYETNPEITLGKYKKIKLNFRKFPFPTPIFSTKLKIFVNNSLASS